MNFLFGKSRLKRAIERGLPDGTLGDELQELGDLKLKTRTDADAVCWGIAEILAGRSPRPVHDANLLATLFQEADGPDSEAVAVFRDQGIPLLLELFDHLGLAPSEELDFLDSTVDTRLFILKILALYGTTEGTLKVIETARAAFEPDAYMWTVVLACYTIEHPEAGLLFSSLGQPLPPGFLGISLLDAANAYVLAGGEITHPFDNPEGMERLRDWLNGPNARDFSFAHSATAALPLLSHPGREQLLTLAMAHPEILVRIEAAWAAAKLGRPGGLELLAAYATDFRYAQTARSYLEELGREDVIPAAGRTPDFVARAEFAHWLSHPTELGAPPDSVEIRDQRTLAWPPSREPRPFWLLQYTLADPTGLEEPDTDLGLVGNITFCLSGYGMIGRPLEDVYAIHCYWEMEQSRLIDHTEVKADAGEYESLLRQWTGAPLEEAMIVHVAELSPELAYPQRLVALAAARLGSADGWVVLDGSRSRWYPRADFPKSDVDSVALKIHVGRHLLGFPVEELRSRFLVPPPAPRPPERIIEAYRRLLADARKLPAPDRIVALDLAGPVGDHLESYADALLRAGRPRELGPTLAELAPGWDHPDGFAALAGAALAAGLDDLAEQYLLRLRETPDDRAHHCSQLGLLAELWCRHGRDIEAKALLLDALSRLVAESQTVDELDRIEIEVPFQAHRATWLKLFPAEGQTALSEKGIPGSTLH